MKKIFTDKRFKYGTYSAVVTVVVTAFLIIINLIAGKLNKSFDFSKTEMGALSNETKEVLSSVVNDIKIYTTFDTNATDIVTERTNQIIDSYKQACSSISGENIDLYLHPDFVKKYSGETEGVARNSIIVVCGDKHKIIPYESYYDESKLSLSLESALTAAIRRVNEDIEGKIYFVSGHGEADPSAYSSFKSKLETAGYVCESIELISKNVPDDCTVLFMTPCTKDYTAEEAEKISDYLAKDGRLFAILGGIEVKKCKNMLSIVNAYGIDLEEGYIYEGNEDKYLQFPYAILPNIAQSDITSGLISASGMLLTPATQALTDTAVKKNDLTKTVILSSSDAAYIKSGQEEKNTSVNKEPGDKEGPFEIAVTVEDNTYTDTSHSTKLFVTGTSFYLLEPNTDGIVNGANSALAVSAVSWLNDKREEVFIPSKSIDNSVSMTLSSGTEQKLKTIVWLVIPGVIFLAGITVGLIRRHK